MRVGVPKETWPGETRVALIPAGVTQLKKAGLDVVVEQRRGTAAGFPDAAYVQAGAESPLDPISSRRPTSSCRFDPFLPTWRCCDPARR